MRRTVFGAPQPEMAGEARRRRLRALLVTAGLAAPVLAAPGFIERFDDAFAHESALTERLAPHSNERLEFLGDALLGYIVADYLMRRYPAADEGELTLRKHALIRDEALARSAERLGFEALLVLGSGLAAAPPASRRSLLADAFEAFIAVLHREAGFERAAAFVVREHVAPAELLPLADDPKNALQEWTQRRYGITPAYVERAEGPDHQRVFHAEVAVQGEALAQGSGNSKKAAQRAAASAALAVLAQRYGDVVARELSAAAPLDRAARR